MQDKEQVTMLAAMFAAVASGLAALLFAAYAISPIDFVPDFLPVVGQADDIGFLLALLYGLQKSGVLSTAMQVWREVSADVNSTVQKAIDEVSKP